MLLCPEEWKKARHSVQQAGSARSTDAGVPVSRPRVLQSRRHTPSDLLPLDGWVRNDVPYYRHHPSHVRERAHHPSHPCRCVSFPSLNE
jgi:hypothetical protein